MADEQIELSSLRPYLIRAHHEWMSDNGLTPHLVVNAERPGVQVPMESVKDGTIVLNIALRAVRDLALGNEFIEFSARFGGVPRQIHVPMEAIRGLVAREYGIGVTFPDEDLPDDEPPDATPPDAGPPDNLDSGAKRPSLRIVK
jgi:stringent starvation protein B